ncbi:MAG TPA: dihydrolipoamide acetyltransferase family protein [Bacteroidales bacterium]|nr:dihydrolipoamide acetyltransferase family protein [Bacteroidales bacterium]
MATFEIIMPKLGESIIEATITKWLKQPGDMIAEDDALVEIATDKVDSEIPSPVEGKLIKRLFEEGDVVAVGTPIALISLDGNDEVATEKPAATAEPAAAEVSVPFVEAEVVEPAVAEPASDRYYSPLVKSIAREEGISTQELDKIQGSGKDGRVTKEDVLAYLKSRGQVLPAVQATAAVQVANATKPAAKAEAPKVSADSGDTIIEMDRMRRLIADHMVMSKQVSPHVTSFIDVDVTNIVNWRNKVKDSFQKKEGEKITFTPIFFEAAAKALKAYPQINASVDGYNIILRKNINIGMATALPSGNLIVPVIKNVDEKSLLGITKNVNDLAARARANKLQPDEIQGGTFTITNFGSFDSLTGTPIINQPQVAILAVGAIRKQPAVIETQYGDVIAIRHIMILALAYDHRVVDGALGGMYLKKMKELLEGFDPERAI